MMPRPGRIRSALASVPIRVPRDTPLNSPKLLDPRGPGARKPIPLISRHDDTSNGKPDYNAEVTIRKGNV